MDVANMSLLMSFTHKTKLTSMSLSHLWVGFVNIYWPNGGCTLLNTELGVAVTVNFFTDRDGGPVIIGLDGSNVTTVDSLETTIVSTGGCTPISWSSENLPFGSHTVAAYISPNRTKSMRMVVHNFV
jgi:hypothetical protein